MVSRGCSRTLGQLLKFAPEYVVHLQPSCNFLRDIESSSSSCVQVHLLQDEEIGILRLEEVDDRWQVQATFDIPVDDAHSLRRPAVIFTRCKAAGENTIHV